MTMNKLHISKSTVTEKVNCNTLVIIKCAQTIRKWKKYVLRTYSQLLYKLLPNYSRLQNSVKHKYILETTKLFASSTNSTGY